MPTHHQKQIRRMNTKASSLASPDDDVLLALNAEYDPVLGGLKKSRGYSQVGDAQTAFSSSLIDTADEWNAGTLSSTIVSGNSLILTGGLTSQLENDDSYQTYAANWFAESFVATNTTLNKVAVLIDKVTGSTLSLYDNFNDNSFDTALWTDGGGGGTITEQNNRLELRSSAPSTISVTADQTNFNGVQFDFGRISGCNNAGVEHFHVKLSGGGTTISVYIKSTLSDTVIRVNNVDVDTISGTDHNWDFRPVGSNIEIYADGTLRYTVTGGSFGGAGTFSSACSSQVDASEIFIDNVYKYVAATALTDVDVRIETNSSSSPSGSAVSNGTTTIDDASVSDESASFQEATFSTPPTLVVGTTYWLVAKQTGGDSNNYYRLYKRNSDVYSNGLVKVSSNSGGTWAADPDGSTDAAFKLYFNYASSGTWISSNQTLMSGQTLSQLVLRFIDISSSAYISQVDITNTSNVVQSSYTTDIVSGSIKTLRTADFSSGFTFTNGNTFRVKLTLASSGSTSPSITSVAVDTPETEIIELAPLYQGKSGSKALMSVIAGTIKRLVSNTWVDVKDNLTSGVRGQAVIFRASKKTVQKSGTAESGDLSSLTDTNLATEPAENLYQGYFMKIVGGTGKGQVRVIQYHTGTSSSTSTTTSSSTSTTTTTTSTTTTTTSTSTTVT